MTRCKRPVRAWPRLRGNHKRGEWAEAAFLAKALGLRFTVCRPFCDTRRFDYVLISGPRKMVRVQVKSSWSQHPNRGYRLTLGHHGRRYRSSEVDFLVGYVVPEDVWYVIPVRGHRQTSIWVFPHHPGTRSRWERYREAWDLLEA